MMQSFILFTAKRNIVNTLRENMSHSELRKNILHCNTLENNAIYYIKMC